MEVKYSPLYYALLILVIPSPLRVHLIYTPSALRPVGLGLSVYISGKPWYNYLIYNDFKRKSCEHGIINKKCTIDFIFI